MAQVEAEPRAQTQQEGGKPSFLGANMIMPESKLTLTEKIIILISLLVIIIMISVNNISFGKNNIYHIHSSKTEDFCGCYIAEYQQAEYTESDPKGRYVNKYYARVVCDSKNYKNYKKVFVTTRSCIDLTMKSKASIEE